MKEKGENSWTYLVVGCLTDRGLIISSAERFAIEGGFLDLSENNCSKGAKKAFLLEGLCYSRMKGVLIYKPVREGEGTHGLSTRSNFQSALGNSSDTGRYFLGAIEIFRLKDTGVQNELPVNYLINRKPQNMIWPDWMKTNCDQFWNKILFYPKIEGACVNTRF